MDIAKVALLARIGFTDDEIARVFAVEAKRPKGHDAPTPKPQADHNDGARRTTDAVDAVAQVVVAKHPRGIVATSAELLKLARVKDLRSNGLTRRLDLIATGKRSHPLITAESVAPREPNGSTVWRLVPKANG